MALSPGAPIAILPAIALALWLGAQRGKKPRLDSLLKGMGEPSISADVPDFLAGGALRRSRYKLAAWTPPST